MTDETVNIEINGQPFEAKKGSMLIEVTDSADIRVPRFCYHHKLSVAANCRMCLVEVEKAPKPLPACATPVMDGMKVFTHSPRALAAQKGTMEFLLINHPLDCPICDQGGECELQDVAMGYGGDLSQYSEGKRVVPDKNLGSLIATDMTRCIHCTRCVRFGQEIAGIRELGATGRGEHTRIGTYIESTVASEMSGNVIDLCPVGALTAKPSRFTARAWELEQTDSVAPHDCMGSNISMHALRNQVNRVVPRDNESINECWLSDRDRFSYEGVNSDDRLTTPMIKVNGEWIESNWDDALEATVKGIKAVCDTSGCNQLGMLISPNATLEEMYLYNRIAEGLGCANIDHRLRQADFSNQDNAPVFPWLGQEIKDLDNMDAALIIGSNLRKEQPIASHRVRKAAMSGANIMFVNTRDYEFNYRVSEKIIAAPDGMIAGLAGIAKSLQDISGKSAPDAIKHLLANVEVSDAQLAMAQHLNAAEKASIILGSQAIASESYSVLEALASSIAQFSGASFGYLTEGANSSGAWLAGAVPHRTAAGVGADTQGMHARAMLESARKAYIIHGLEPELDCYDPQVATAAMNTAEFVLSLSSYETDAIKQYANVMLPIATFAETSGTYVNAEGSWQSFVGACSGEGSVRPAWKVLRVMGNLLNLDGFEYMSSEEVRDELKGKTADVKVDNNIKLSGNAAVPGKIQGVARISGTGIYDADALVRRARSLKNTPDADTSEVLVSSQLAQKLGLSNVSRVLVRQGSVETSMDMKIDDSVANGCAWISSGTESSSNLGPMFGSIELEAD